jgi:hypothetical protein
MNIKNPRLGWMYQWQKKMTRTFWRLFLFCFFWYKSSAVKTFRLFFLAGLLASAFSLFFFLKPSSLKYQYELTICAMFKDEAPWLPEWIDYHHHVLGFQHFYLYNNDSSDNYKDVLQPYLEKGIVDLIEWSSNDEKHRVGDDAKWMPFQVGAYNDCRKNRALGRAKWVAFIDIDEFITPVHGVQSFHKLLRKLEKKRVGNVKFSWRVFGTSDVWDLDSGEWLTEKLVFRAPDDHPMHKWFKVMIRPEAVAVCHIHDVLKMNRHFRRYHADPNEFRIHHYWTRTGKTCFEKRGFKKPENQSLLDDLKVVEDRTMEQYLPIMKSHL